MLRSCWLVELRCFSSPRHRRIRSLQTDTTTIDRVHAQRCAIALSLNFTCSLVSRSHHSTVPSLRHSSQQ